MNIDILEYNPNLRSFDLNSIDKFTLRALVAYKPHWWSSTIVRECYRKAFNPIPIWKSDGRLVPEEVQLAINAKLAYEEVHN